jgi:hypothetical protein
MAKSKMTSVELDEGCEITASSSEKKNLGGFAVQHFSSSYPIYCDQVPRAYPKWEAPVQSVRFILGDRKK